MAHRHHHHIGLSLLPVLLALAALPPAFAAAGPVERPEAAVYAYLNQEHVVLERLQVVPHSFRVEDLIEGKVDAMAGYLTDEPYRLDQAQIPYLVLSPQSAGIDFYGDSLFTWLYWSGLAGLSAVVVCAVIIAYIVRLNRRLRRQIREKETVSRELNQANQHLHAQLAEIQALQEQLRRDAIRDSLTDLYNRRYFEETLARELSRAERDAYPVGLAVIDVDYFKQVNDRHGHQVGDAVLHELGQLLERHIRAGDIACRYGGEEFVVVLPNTGVETTRERAEQWRRVCAEHSIPTDGTDITVTLSVGIAMFPDHGHSQKTLFAAADQALYRAKRAGRNRVAVFAQSETQA